MTVSYDTPACWGWDLPGAELVAQLGRSSDLLHAWQQGRCAACGMDAGYLVEDHDHDTGLVRGYLCRRCNIREGLGGGPIMAGYRGRHPARMLGVVEQYVDIFGRTPRRPPPWTDGQYAAVAQQIERALSRPPEGDSRPAGKPTRIGRRGRPPKPRCGRGTKRATACGLAPAVEADACHWHMTRDEAEVAGLARVVARVFED